MPLTDRDRLEALGIIHEVRMELTALQKTAVRIEMAGKSTVVVHPSDSGWMPVEGFVDESGQPNFFQQALPLDDSPNDSSWIRTRGSIGTGSDGLLSVPVNTVLWVLQGSLEWTIGTNPPYLLHAPTTVSTPANCLHAWTMLEDTQCVVEICAPAHPQ